MLLNAIVVKLDQEKNGMDLVLKEVGIMTQGEWEMAVEEVAWCLHIQGTKTTPSSLFPADLSKLWLCLDSTVVSVQAALLSGDGLLLHKIQTHVSMPAHGSTTVILLVAVLLGCTEASDFLQSLLGLLRLQV